MRTTHFWNNIHQICSIPKDWRAKFNVLGAIKQMGPKQDSQNRLRSFFFKLKQPCIIFSLHDSINEGHFQLSYKYQQAYLNLEQFANKQHLFENNLWLLWFVIKSSWLLKFNAHDYDCFTCVASWYEEGINSIFYWQERIIYN